MATTQPPYDRLGVFKELGDVPDRRRLSRFTSGYEGRDVWREYRATVNLSETMSTEWGIFIRRWKTHMKDRGRHHALARPSDVETWSEWMLGEFGVDRAYQHFAVIEGFYSWLMWHTDHPHSYNPFHMAAADAESSAGTIWGRKMEKAND